MTATIRTQFFHIITMSTSNQSPAGTLYVVATPIGNLEDITLRAIRILKSVDLVAAEDTRHTKKLLNHLGINTPLIAYYREKEQERGREILARLQEGQNVALVSDAGTPGISDPGAVLVDLCHTSGIIVSPIPGPSASSAALSCAGFENTTFLFIGFCPTKKRQRQKLLDSLVHSDHALIFYEAPRRVREFLSDALDTFGDRQVLVARELTKAFEDIRRSTLKQLVERMDGIPQKGEFVLIISPGEKQNVPEGENIEELLTWYRDNTDLTMKDVCKQLASDLGISRSKIYQQALTIWKNR